MGPYYRATSQGTGAFFDMLYERPELIFMLMAGAIAVGWFIWRKNKVSGK